MRAPKTNNPRQAFWDPKANNGAGGEFMAAYHGQWMNERFPDSRDVLVKRPNGQVMSLEQILCKIDEFEAALTEQILLGAK